MWRRTLAVAAVLAMTFALAPHQPGRAQEPPVDEEDVDKARKTVEEEAPVDRPAVWAARKVSITDNYGDPQADDVNHLADNRLFDVVFPTPTHGYAIGRRDDGKGTQFLLKTVNGGRSWFPVASPLPEAGGERRLSFVTETTGYVPLDKGSAGENPGLMRTTDGGASFQGSLPHHSVGNVAFVTEQQGWATAKFTRIDLDDVHPMSTDTVQFLMTTDGGTTWEAMSADAEDGRGVVSGDGGDTWDETNTPPPGAGVLPDGVELGDLEVVGGPTDPVLYLTAPATGEVYRSDDAGASWTPLELQGEADGVEIDEVSSMHAVEEDVAFVVGVFRPQAPDEAEDLRWDLLGIRRPVVARTLDGGDTWEDVSPSLAPVPETGQSDAGLPVAVEPRDVAFVRDPDGGLTGHVVGVATSQRQFGVAAHYPVAFTTTTGHEDDVQWGAEPVDGSAFPDWRVSGFSTNVRLNGVAVTHYEDDKDGDGIDEVHLRSVAVGDSWAIVERTDDPSADNLQDACVPAGLAEAVKGANENVRQAVGDAEQQVEDTSPIDLPSVVCEPMEKAAQAAAEKPAFDPQPAGPCTDGEGAEVVEGADAPFPCVGEIGLRDEAGGNRSFSDPMYDRALGRVVMMNASETGATRVAMFDPAAMVQRGVEGFGDGFGGDSVWGHHTGVVNFAHVDAAVPNRIIGQPTLMPVDPEARRHSVAMVGCGPEIPNSTGNCLPAYLVTASLTGQFLPRVAHAFEPIHIGVQSHVISNVLHLAYDESNRVLYALTEYSPAQSSVPTLGTNLASVTEPHQVLHAFDADPQDDSGGLRKMWSTEIDPACKRADHGNFENMGVSPDGRALAFACQGADFPYWGFVAFTPHGIVRVGLPEGTDPRELTQADTGDIDQRFYALPAQIGTGVTGRMKVWADSSTGLVFWNAPRTITRVYDFAADRWIGSFKTPVNRGVAADPDTGRLYISTNESPPRMRMAETVNLPVSVRRPVELAAGTFDSPLFVADARRLLTTGSISDSGTTVRLFEDRIPPAQHLGVDDPDVDTNDIDESEAAVVRRDGQAGGYGSRVWWSGLRTVLPGLDGSLTDGTGGALFATWEWLFTPEDSPTGTGFGPNCNADLPAGVWPVCHGYFTSNIPGMASSTQREVMFGRVSTAELTASTDEKESEAVAASQGVDDDSQQDVRRRRLLSEWRRYVDGTVLGPWDNDSTYPGESWGDNEDRFDEGRDRMFGHDGWREFERCADEGADRLWRELDGERRVSPPIDEDGNQPDDCFEQFDEDDPRGDDRSSVMEETGAVAASRCHDEDTGNARAREARGAEVDCDAAGERTAASAELGGFALRSPEGQQPAGWLSVGSSTSDSTVVRDAEQGIVVESTASARDIEMGMAGQGSVRIGEVRSKAKSWAKGRPGTADSWLDVAFEDVRITGEEGKVRFSCGRAEEGDPATPDAGYHRGEDDVDGAHGACDPDAVVEAINRGFADRVQATTPGRDTDDKIAGSPGGARAIVRRDPSAYWSDFVVNNFSRWEIPALQLTFFNDGPAGPNRMLVDLAGVFAASTYVVGEPLGSYDSGGGTGDGDFDPGPATVTVELTDTDGTPLDGGQFGLTDEDGAPTGTCTTDEDGACEVTGLPAGDYEVSQVSAPAGYLPADDTAPLSLAAGGHATVTFANVWAAGGVTILLTDPAEQPLADGAFELLTADPEGEATVADTCTTGDDGTCAFPDVPLGDVAVRQTATPDGYQPAEPVAFALTSPGQVARLHVINGPAGAGTSGTRGQVVDDPMPQTERISLASSPPAFTGGTQPPEVAEPDGLLGRALVLPGQVARFALRNPGQALLFTLVWLLVGAPLYLAVRRRELNHVKQWS